MKKIYILAVLIVLVAAGAGFWYLSSVRQENSPANIPGNSGEMPKEVTEPAVNSAGTQDQSGFSQNTEIAAEEEEKLYTMAEVAAHNSRSSCWTVIRGDIYDLTQWVNEHPGGPVKILNLCGKDGTQAFGKKHGGQEKPEQKLEQFKIGALKNP
jgi:cytochrome b involved in lipid metabolism